MDDLTSTYRSDTAEASTTDSDGPTRRRVLRESVLAVSTIGLGLGAVGTAAANGKGGEAAVPATDFDSEKEQFYFDEFTGNRVRKTCDKGGQGIVLAEWTFHYEGEDAGSRTIYTRDNAIDTSNAYAFAGKGELDCGGFYLTPYSRAKDQ